MKTLFDHKTYKSYLSAAFGGNKRRNGRRTLAARHLRIQTAYLSQVINGNANLSLEQGHALSDFLGHDHDEREFFLLLLSRDRAGTRELKSYFQNKLDEMSKKRAQIKSRVLKDTQLSLDDQTIYYSHWYYACIHVMLSIPALQEKEALAKHLHLPMATVSEVLSFLESRGLVVFENGRYRQGSRFIHTPSDSPHMTRLHGNWRTRALVALDAPKSQDLHYSVVVTLSRHDVAIVRSTILRMIEDNMRVIGPSKEECAFACTVDLFEI